VVTAKQLQGKELSYNNINDTNAAFELVSEFNPEEGSAIAIIKHANPCGVAVGKKQSEVFNNALACDSTSAFGSIIALNTELSGDTAKLITEIFTEVIIAPSISKDAERILSEKKNLRVMITGGIPDPLEENVSFKTVSGGFLTQSRDNISLDLNETKIVTKRKPTDSEVEDLIFAFKVAKHVKSNAIVYAKNKTTVGIGAGQMNRLDSSRIAARKSLDAALALGNKDPLAVGSVVASDAFFPFADGLMAAAEAGATAIIQPGGSIRDDEVIQAADEENLAMIFTSIRHFNH
jgi:phosphoribosylaminoimidazolecarboxamide formyltransferase/IMP cyclohydrolase